MKTFYLYENPDGRIVLHDELPKTCALQEFVEAENWLGAYKALDLTEKKLFYRRREGHGYAH